VLHFSASFDVACPIDAVFEWHRDTRNAALISPPSLRVERVEGSFPLEKGDRVRLVVRPRGSPLRQRWLVRIAEMRAPQLIVDEMEKGPFARWHHEHAFADLGDGRTRVTDTVAYALPLRIDRLAGPIVQRLMARTFTYRHRRSREVLEALPQPGRITRPDAKEDVP
jgi:uncharacterized protein